MRIAFVGNQDNNAYRLCRWLRDAGNDAQLYLYTFASPPSERSRPEFVDRGTTEGGDGSSPWIKNYGQHKHLLDLFTATMPLCAEIEDHFDVVVTSGYEGLYVANHFRKLPVVHMSLGGEVTDLPWLIWKAKTRRGLRVLSWLARRNLKHTALIVTAFKPTMESLIRLGLKDKMRIWHFPEDTAGNPDRVDQRLLEKLNERYAQYNKVFLWLSRLNFLDESISDYKGPEHFLQAFRKILEDSRENLLAVIGDHGMDVQAFKRLVDELGLTRHVQYVPHLPYWELLTYLSIKNAIVFDELDINKGELSGIAREALSVAAVVVKTLDEELIRMAFGPKCPVFSVWDTESCLRVMRQLTEVSDVEFSVLKQRSRDWASKFLHYQNNTEKFINLLREAVYVHRLRSERNNQPFLATLQRSQG